MGTSPGTVLQDQVHGFFASCNILILWSLMPSPFTSAVLTDPSIKTPKQQHNLQGLAFLPIPSMAGSQCSRYPLIGLWLLIAGTSRLNPLTTHMYETWTNQRLFLSRNSMVLHFDGSSTLGIYEMSHSQKTTGTFPCALRCFISSHAGTTHAPRLQ